MLKLGRSPTETRQHNNERTQMTKADTYSWLCRWEVNYQQTEVRRVDECNVGHVVVEFERPSKSTCRSLTSLGAWSGT